MSEHVTADWRAGTTGTCRTCGSDRVVRIEMQLTDGSAVELTSCLECETRTWLTAEGEVLAVAEVLDRARKPR